MHSPETLGKLSESRNESFSSHKNHSWVNSSDKGSCSKYLSDFLQTAATNKITASLLSSPNKHAPESPEGSPLVKMKPMYVNTNPLRQERSSIGIIPTNYQATNTQIPSNPGHTKIMGSRHFHVLGTKTSVQVTPTKPSGNQLGLQRNELKFHKYHQSADMKESKNTSAIDEIRDLNFGKDVPNDQSTRTPVLNQSYGTKFQEIGKPLNQEPRQTSHYNQGDRVSSHKISDLVQSFPHKSAANEVGYSPSPLNQPIQETIFLKEKDNRQSSHQNKIPNFLSNMKLSSSTHVGGFYLTDGRRYEKLEDSSNLSKVHLTSDIQPIGSHQEDKSLLLNYHQPKPEQSILSRGPSGFQRPSGVVGLDNCHRGSFLNNSSFQAPPSTYRSANSSGILQLSSHQSPAEYRQPKPTFINFFDTRLQGNIPPSPIAHDSLRTYKESAKILAFQSPVTEYGMRNQTQFESTTLEYRRNTVVPAGRGNLYAKVSDQVFGRVQSLPSTGFHPR